MDSTETPPQPDTFEDWNELDIAESLLRGIYAYGFERPTPIQKKAILPLIQGRDILAQAQSGTGKTGAFVIGALSKIDVALNETQVVIFSPTRELTRQIYTVVENLSSNISDIKHTYLTGGTPLDTDIKYLRANKPHLIVACPGRFYDMYKKGYIRLDKIKLLVMDETDELLSEGFKTQMQDIFRYLNENIQIGLFSATYSPEIMKITEQILRNPVSIIVKSDSLTLEGIKQFYCTVENDAHKCAMIKDIFQTISLNQTIIFCNTISRVVELTRSLEEEGFPVCMVHSNLDKKERDTNFNEFKNGKYRILISSNITARGIDLHQISIVINFDIPNDKHTFLHRCGRSGRYGRKGVVINLITRYDVNTIRDIETYYHTQIEELPLNFGEYI